MQSPLVLLRRLRGTVRSDRFESQLDAELQHHLALEIEANVRRGLDPAAARAEALRTFGSVAQVKDDCRDSWGMRALDAVMQDLRFGGRSLRKHPGYAAIVVLTLALGIGANTALFSVVHAVLLAPLPYANGERLVEIRQEAPGIGLDDMSLSAKEVADYRAQAATLDAVVEYHQMSFNLLGRGEASRVQTGVVSANFFDVLGVRPMLGRTFVAADDRKDAPPVLVLSYDYWQRALGGDPHVVGRTFEMNDKVHTVVGVLPPVPQYPQENDVYMPVSACPFRSSPQMAEDRSMRMVSAIGRLRPGVSVERASADLAVIARRLAAAYPADYKGAAGAGFTTVALSVRNELTRGARPTLLVLLAITGFVLLLVCANVANLTLARLSGRDRELSLRAALGAGRSRIARQLFTESLLLAGAGGALGLGVAALVENMLVVFTARFTPRAAEIALDPAVLVFAAAVSLGTGVLFGLLPAFSHRDPAGGLKDGERVAAGSGGRARRALIAAQVAISFVLLIGAGLLVRSFIRLEQVDAGFNPDRVLTMRLSLDWVKYDSAEKRRAIFRQILDRLHEQPGVRASAIAISFPLDQSTPYNTDFLVEGHPIPADQPTPQADYRIISPEYFRAVGMKVLRGRAFTDADNASAPNVAIVNLSMMRHLFGGQDPIGRRVSFDSGKHWTRVVGLVNDVRQYGLDHAATDEVYLPLEQNGPLGATIMIRTAADPRSYVRTVQDVVRRIDPKQPLSHVETLEDARSTALASPRLTMLLVSLFAVMALLITATGIAGVVSFAVSQRTTEIGVRMALGAPRASVVAMVVRQGLTPVLVGLSIGLMVAVPLAHAARRLLFEVRPGDPPTFAVVAVMLAAVAALACLVPARRAATIDPMQALRAE
ncbi:MAG: ADOP family duplicated permease [Betaproteobacteria bacterium]